MNLLFSGAYYKSLTNLVWDSWKLNMFYPNKTAYFLILEFQKWNLIGKTYFKITSLSLNVHRYLYFS